MKNKDIFILVINAVQLCSGVDDLKNISREREIVDARRIAYHILREVFKMKLQTIADEFNKTHATILHSLRDVEFLIKSDRFFKIAYEESIERVKVMDCRKEQILYEIQELQKELLTIDKLY